MSATLISCPACSRQVSMAAASCIHCGHPIKSSGINMNAVTWLLGIGCVLILGLGIYKNNPVVKELAATWFEFTDHVSSENISSPATLNYPSKRARVAFITADAREDLSSIADQLHHNARPYWNQHYKVDRIHFAPDQRLLRISYWVQPDIAENDIPMGVFVNSYCRDSAYQIFRDYGVTGHIIFKNESTEVASRNVDPNTCV